MFMGRQSVEQIQVITYIILSRASSPLRILQTPVTLPNIPSLYRGRQEQTTGTTPG